MTFATLACAYLAGGLTFLPLLVLAVLLPAWLLLPQVDEYGRRDGTRSSDGDSNEGQDEAGKKPSLPVDDKFRGPDGSASAEATFAVLRSYNFPTALAAMEARSRSITGEADGTEAAGSESVYQSMYRSVFDRSSKNASAAAKPLLDGEDGDAPNARLTKAAAAKHCFYVVLRHSHLMLYDSTAQVDVRHVISLAHHNISVSEGEPTPAERAAGVTGGKILEGDLFIKRAAIVLTPTSVHNGGLDSSRAAKPFYLFSSDCSEKEDFYHALLAASPDPPSPLSLEADHLIKLQSTLHSSHLSAETRALNALISRVFLALHRTRHLETLVRAKIEKKIARVQKPAFITSIAVQSIDLGDSAPILSNLRLVNLNISGETTIAMDLRYTGGVKVTIAAVAKIDLGTRFKARTVDLVLAGSLQKMTGHMLVKVKPPPSNRLWVCFESMPEMDIKVEPVVSSRQITYTFILRAIENRIREVVAETLVQPNWDDVPFFDTIQQAVRGGIWQRGEGEKEGTKDIEALAKRRESTASMPVLRTSSEDRTSLPPSGASTPLYAPPPEMKESLKRRSAATLPAEPPSSSTGVQILPPPKPLRSPSFADPASATASAPSVAIDSQATANAVRADEMPAPTRRWGTLKRNGTQSQQNVKRDAVDHVREVRDKNTLQQQMKGTASASDSELVSPLETALETDEGEHSPTSQERGVTDTLPLPQRRKGSDAASTLTTSSRPGTSTSQAPSQASVTSAEPRRRDSDITSLHSARSFSSQSPSTASTSNRSTSNAPASNASSQQRSAKFLASATTAATAARQWGWNAIANRRGSPSNPSSSPLPYHPNQHQSQRDFQPEKEERGPMGRGQPLPPPGTPLPGPERSKSTLWSASMGAAGGVLGGSGVKRKPVTRPALPPRPNAESASSLPESGSEAKSEGEQNSHMRGGKQAAMETEAEFGPWSENFEDVTPGDTSSATVEEETHSPLARNEKATPPPLPKRRTLQPAISTSSFEDASTVDDTAASATSGSGTRRASALEERDVVAIPAPVESQSGRETESAGPVKTRDQSPGDGVAEDEGEEAAWGYVEDEDDGLKDGKVDKGERSLASR
ncbi:hypothetical protein MBLNU230_g6764t1 [Neophaeotheca triangularis]